MLIFIITSVYCFLSEKCRFLRPYLFVLFMGNAVFCTNAEDAFSVNNDYLLVFQNTANQLKVTQNDIIPSECSNSISVAEVPKHGVATVSGSDISYTPAIGYIGKDSITYSLSCGAETGLAKVYINVVSRPDNVNNAHCFTEPEAIIFSVKEVAKTAPVVSTVTNPICGDIDGDGEIEILVMNLTRICYSDSILIYGFNSKSNTLYQKYAISVPVNSSNLTFSPIAIAKVDNNPYASIFYASSEYGNLIKYDFNGSEYTQTWSVAYTRNGHYAVVSPTIADIMGNGRTQVCVLDKVYDTKTGALLATGGFILDTGYLSSYSFGRFGHGNSLWTVWACTFESMMIAVDIDDDGIKELIGGDYVYGVNLTNFDGLTGNSFTLKQQAQNTGHPEIGDGGTAIADVDNDGELEVIVCGPYANGYNTVNIGMLYVYNPRTGEVIHTNSIGDIPRDQYVFGPSRPFVGDVDGDGYPEICLTGEYVLQNYKYNINARTLDLVWNLPTADFSGSTTLTMFDFAQDGKARLVYRDEESLRIMDASTNPPTIEVLVDRIYSPTVNEFPIIADINGDGAAEIILTGSPFEDWNENTNWAGELRIYASDGKPWAPARPVWNQSAYNVLNVNEDLTIPQNSLSPATVFPGKDGILGTSDDVRPFNNFLQQQTMLNRNGNPLWVVPDYELEKGWNIQGNPDRSATIHFCVSNIGNAQGTTPFFVSLYKEGWDAANLLATESYNTVPGVREKICYDLIVPGFDGIDATEFILSVNDKGESYVIPECDYTNNLSNITYEGPDSMVICAGESVEFAYADESDIPPGATIEILQDPKYGIWQDLGENMVRYTSLPPYSSEVVRDTLFFDLKNEESSFRSIVIIRIDPLPLVSITGQSTIRIQNTTTLSPSSGGTWVSNNSDVASVSGSGTVTGLSDGTATFTFTDELTGCSATTGIVTVIEFYAENDSIEVISCGGAEVTIPILLNDPMLNYSGCTDPVVTLLTAPTISGAQATIEDNELNYHITQIAEKDDLYGFAAGLKDSIQYEISCGTKKSSALVYVFIKKGDQNTIKLALDPQESILCIYGEPIELTATIIDTELPETDITWSWTPALSAQNNVAQYVPSYAGIEPVTVTATDLMSGCAGIGTFYITVQDSSRITIAPDNQYVCQDGEQEITLIAKVETGDPAEIVWYDNDRTLIDPDKTSSKWNVLPLDYESVYWAYAVDPVCGDSPYAYTTVYITNKVYLVLKADTTQVQIGDKVTLTVTPTNDEHGTYRWYNAITGELLGETDSNTFDYVLDNAGNTAFYVLTDNNYCPEAQSNSVNVNVADYFIIPNIITPYNHNQLNDSFMTPREGRSGYKVEIYNRYQQKVFEGNNGWDGTYRGRLAEPGTYFYRLYMKDGKVLKGTVEVAKF